MRFLFDQSTDLRLVPYLRQAGHDITAVEVDYPGGLPDEEVLAIAHREGRVLITQDLDFGDLVFRHHQPHSGVILLRLRAMELAVKIERLAHVLDRYGDNLHQFVVVTPTRVRVRATADRGGS